MSLFRKPKKALRNRGPVEPEDDDDQDNSIEEIHSNISKLKQKKQEKKKIKDKQKDEKKSLLSFDDEFEDETEEFVIKKSKESRRLIKQKERGKKDDFRENKPRKNSPEFENFKPKHIGPTNNHDNGNNVKIIDDDIEIVLKDTVPKKPVDTWVISGKEAEALHLEEEDFSEEDEVESDDEDPLKKIIQSGAIPDAAAIHAARKKREAAREKGGKEDFIPIKNVEKKSSKGPRLLREEDEDDDEERICFTVKEKAKEDEYHKKVGKDREAHDDSDSDPEWEKMQISKAINNQQIIAASKDAVLNAELGIPRPPLPPNISGDTTQPRTASSRKGDGALARPQKYDLPGIRERMKSKLVLMKEVHRRHEMDADRAVDDLVESQGEIDNAGAAVPDLANKHKFYQELRGYMTDLTDCYDEKVGTITYLEGRINKVYSEQRGKLRERRRQDVRDQADVLAAMTATNMALLMDPVQDAVRDYRVAEREGRRIRRRQARQGRGEMRHNDGLSSDDEMPSTDMANLAKVKHDVENQARMVLDDVVEEFSVISKVMERLQSWRSTDPESYQSAYVSLCLPKIFSPLIRMQMLFWSPFTSSTGVSDHEWYSTLATYAVSSGDTFSEFSSDQDRLLVSACCEKVVLPKLVGIVRASYDPLSTTQTNKLVGCVNRLVTDFPTLTPRSKQVRELLAVVVDLVKECLDNDVYIPMYTKHQMESPNTPHSLFFHRQFWTSFRLFKNILAWAAVLSDSILVELVVDRLLNRYMLLSLRASMDMLDSIDKARQIVSILPDWWLKSGSPELAKLGLLSKFVAGAGSGEGLAREGVVEAAKIVKRLGDAETGEKLRELLY